MSNSLYSPYKVTAIYKFTFAQVHLYNAFIDDRELWISDDTVGGDDVLRRSSDNSS